MEPGQTEQAKSLILDLVGEFAKKSLPDQAFEPGVTPILPSGAVLDEDDRVAVVEAALEMRIAAGATAQKFERAFARSLGLRKAHMTNSGSSANLLALTALTSPRLAEARLMPGDEVITVAAAFPTTVNPIVQNSLTPVFVDIELATYNTTAERVASAIGPRTRAIMLAHALGNPYEVAEIADLAAEHGMFLIEDNCDAVGSVYRGKLTGGFGDASTVSLYPAHHITCGEGGCVMTNNLVLARIVESLRDWGRDCWCLPGENDVCHKRFSQQLGCLPYGYDHKYVFSHVGFNLKSTDLQAALALSQLAKLPEFVVARRRNWQRLYEGLHGLPWLLLPSAAPGSDPSWFGFVLTVTDGAPFGRPEIIRFLESRKIGTRLLFAGNLTRQPAYLDHTFRVVGDLANSDVAAERTFWIGVYPGITEEMTTYMVESIHEFMRGWR
jgi:NDP-hexose-3,4-dehydratase